MMEALLSKDPIVTCLYRRKTDGKFLVCKSKYNKKIGLPIVKILVSNYSIQHGKATSKDVSVQVVNTFRKEFGLDPEILNYYEGTKTSFVNNGVILNGNNIAFDMTDAGEYKGKPTITQNPSGDYTEVQWMSYNQILELVKTNLFDSSSLYYVLRSREQHRIKPILDSRLSLRVYADKTGLKIYNDPTDQMPIQGLDMSKGIEYYCKDFVPNVYKIYTDGDVVNVMGYSGLGDLYNEALQTIYTEEIARGVDIQSANHITSSQEFHTMLVEQLNRDNIARVESQPVTLDENGEEIEPLVQSMQRVITTINFCCRVDLEDGSIYIGEGYENLLKNILNDSTEYYRCSSDGTFTVIKNGGAIFSYVNQAGETNDHSLYFYIDRDLKLADNTTININGGLSSAPQSPSGFYDKTNFSIRRNGYGVVNGLNKKVTVMINPEIGSYKILKQQLTKTSTPKPFVKSMMPSGKLAFITNATSETHSFVMKNVRYFKSESPTDFNYYRIYSCGSPLTSFERQANQQMAIGENIHDLLFNSNYANFNRSQGSVGLTSGVLKFKPASSEKFDSFSQLLIYKGNLTESELKAENGKLDFIQFEL